MEGQLRSEEIVRSHIDRVYLEYCNCTGSTKDKNFLPQSCCVLTNDEHVAAGDIGGDMNYVHRVRLKVLPEPQTVKVETGYKLDEGVKYFSVIVKTAPTNVRYLKEICGEEVVVDPHRVVFEVAALTKLFQIQSHCVPKVYFLDTKSNSIIMEDLTEYRKLEDTIRAGEIEMSRLNLESALKCIGRVHYSTWLNRLEGKERSTIMTEFTNHKMKELMSELLFDRPFNSAEKSNCCNHHLLKEIEEVRSDPCVLSRMKELRSCFLTQMDCLCHGDFSFDNILVRKNEFKIIDMEFAGVGLRAYDIALMLESVLFHLFCQFYHGNQDKVKALQTLLHTAVDSYSLEVKSRPDSCASCPEFVEQVCGLVGFELMWRVLGSYKITEFEGAVEPELKLLALAKSFVLCTDKSVSISDNINRHLLKTQLINIE